MKSRAREVRRANAHAERVTKLFGALTRRAGHAHARRVLHRATGVEQPSKLPVPKWEIAAVALRLEVEAMNVADRARAILASRLEDDADDALTKKARRLIRGALAEFADAAIADAIARHDRAAEALEANRLADEDRSRRAAAENYRANAGGLAIVDEDVTLPWLIVWRARNFFDEARQPTERIRIDEPAPDARIAFDVSDAIGIARVDGNAVRFVFVDGPEFAISGDALIYAFDIAESRKWFNWKWRDNPVDAHRYGDGAGNFVTR